MQICYLLAYPWGDFWRQEVDGELWYFRTRTHMIYKRNSSTAQGFKPVKLHWLTFAVVTFWHWKFQFLKLWICEAASPCEYVSRLHAGPNLQAADYESRDVLLGILLSINQNRLRYWLCAVRLQASAWPNFGQCLGGQFAYDFCDYITGRYAIFTNVFHHEVTHNCFQQSWLFPVF